MKLGISEKWQGHRNAYLNTYLESAGVPVDHPHDTVYEDDIYLDGYYLTKGSHSPDETGKFRSINRYTKKPVWVSHEFDEGALNECDRLDAANCKKMGARRDGGRI